MTQTPTVQTTPYAEKRPRNQGPIRLALLVAVPLLAALAALVVYLQGGRYVETDNAYIKADKIPVSTLRPACVHTDDAGTLRAQGIVGRKATRQVSLTADKGPER